MLTILPVCRGTATPIPDSIATMLQGIDWDFSIFFSLTQVSTARAKFISIYTCE